MLHGSKFELFCSTVAQESIAEEVACREISCSVQGPVCGHLAVVVEMKPELTLYTPSEFFDDWSSLLYYSFLLFKSLAIVPV